MVDENWREGRFKIAKQTGRYAHFASVALRARPATTDDVSIAPDVRAQIWRTAIASGVQEALEKLRAMGALGCAEVQVTDFLYMDVDTTEETARLAAFLATLSAFLDTSQMPSLRLSEDHRRFLLDWPDQEQT